MHPRFHCFARVFLAKWLGLKSLKGQTNEELGTRGPQFLSLRLPLNAIYFSSSRFSAVSRAKLAVKNTMAPPLVWAYMQHLVAAVLGSTCENTPPTHAAEAPRLEDKDGRTPHITDSLSGVRPPRAHGRPDSTDSHGLRAPHNRASKISATCQAKQQSLFVRIFVRAGVLVG